MMRLKIVLVFLLIISISIFVCGCSNFMENIGLVTPVNEEEASPEKGDMPKGLIKVLIGFKDKPGPTEQALVNSLGGKIKKTYNIIPAMAASLPEKAIEALKKNPNIMDIELDGLVYALDTELDSSWGVDRIDAEVVHSTGSNKGDGVEIAIIDTGIDYTHTDLNDNYAGGYDFVNLDNDPMDDDGHGTHVAGIIGAEDDNKGVVGVAPEARLYALKALDNTGVGYISDIISAIQWATDPDGNGSADDRLDIINMSLGATVGNIFLKWACKLAYRDGLLIVAAAGNEYRGSVIYPAAYAEVVAVSASGYDVINHQDFLAGFSSTGNEVELAAPGVDINSTFLGGGYKVYDGTSMASPHVAGAAALVWAENSSWSNKDIRSHLQLTAEDIGLSATEQGYGLVDAENATLGTANGDNLNGEQPATGDISGTVTEAGSDSPINGAEVTTDGHSAFANSDGNYTLSDLPVGTYTLTVSKNGYVTKTQTGFVVNENLTTTVDFVLEPESTQTNTMHVKNIE